VPAAVTAAQQEAERRKVQAELAELRAEAERRGYAVGHEKGEAEGRRLLQAQIDRFQGLAAQLVQARAAVLADAEDGVVELAFAALCRILGEQAASRDGVHAMVARCAADVREREQVGIRLHPDDVALLDDGAGHHARFSADPGIALGGCIVDSSTGALDARLETQLTRLAETLLAVRAARRGGEGA
jgi:flagellar assembly protein FliH